MAVSDRMLRAYADGDAAAAEALRGRLGALIVENPSRAIDLAESILRAAEEALRRRKGVV